MAQFNRFAAILLIISLATPLFAADEWWDWDWHYRVKVDVNASGFERDNWIVEQPMDFSEVLGSISGGKQLDPDSIRVIAYEDGEVSDEAVSQFDEDYAGSWAGELVWRMDGLVRSGEAPTYYAYFDTLDNGPKPAAGYPSEVLVQSREEDIRLDNEFLMIYMDRTRYGYNHLIRKTYPWQNVVSPDIHDPLARSRPNVSDYRGFLSRPGEHFCDPGCEWSHANSTTSVVHEGPLRATVRTTNIAISRNNDTEFLAFDSSQIYQIYAGKTYYREKRIYLFNESPQDVAGMNRRTWIFSGRSMQYAYPAADGTVHEGQFPDTGAEFKDWNGTWADSYDGNNGIGDFDLKPAQAPRSLWAEGDALAPASYYGSLWRPNRIVGEVVEFDTLHYFHDGNWADADVPMRYAELANPPLVQIGGLSNFLLTISVPSVILNWNPIMPVKTEIKGNVTITNVTCKVRSKDRGVILYDGPLSEGGISIFDVPEGSWTVDCIAFESNGLSSYDTTETRVYDIMSLVKVCCGTFIVIFLIMLALSLRIRAGLRRPSKGPPCPRCGMPLEPNTSSCPVCGKRMK